MAIVTGELDPAAFEAGQKAVEEGDKAAALAAMEKGIRSTIALEYQDRVLEHARRAFERRWEFEKEDQGGSGWMRWMRSWWAVDASTAVRGSTWSRTRYPSRSASSAGRRPSRSRTAFGSGSFGGFNGLDDQNVSDSPSSHARR